MKLNFLFLIIVFITASTAFSQNSAKDEDALKKLVDQMTTAQSAYDADALDRLFTADYIEISPAGEFDPRAKVLTFYSPEWKAKSGGVAINIEKIYPSIRIYGPTAVVITEMAYTMSKDGQSRPGPKIMATIVARKEKDRWKIASAQYTGIKPPPSPKPSGK